ncbi:MAG TPA: tetratricopeptide repeat protein [Smithella sp.]|nr:tetratricopeptide repeat protein [Smithella sp.]MDM7987586.1 tetratricopeptide repeat protein [Smithella sp.]HNY51144.1 tetratricopeptide repeat protein [Smithella sp.]HOG90578.1 tetratricopeptide repeat protein [Smithella sp.]HOU50412.1 tetratricopeptide repeat protein [Smithella sp.]
MGPYFIDMRDTSSYTLLVKNDLFVPQNNTFFRERHGCLIFALVIILVAAVFAGSLKLGWTNWDDNLLIYENPLVKEPNLKDIFTKPAAYNTYNPLVIASFALEWKLAGDRPFLYHLDNLILHLLCTALVLLFFRRMGISIWWSGFGALLFGLHPMRVESVAWITERKDVLYGFFYLSALLAYIRYLASGKTGYFLLTFLLFVLSLFSKGQAVALPFSLVLLDWYFDRKIDRKAMTEKLTFFVFALFIGLLGTTFFFQNVYKTIDSKAIVNAFNFFEQLVLAGYAYVIYILKFFIPYVTSTLYPVPDVLHTGHWVGAVTAVLIFAWAVSVWRKYKFITFGLLFFTFNTVFLLMPFLANDSAYLNDRYIYMAYVGLAFAVTFSLQKLAEQKNAWRRPLALIAVAVLVIFSVVTMKYIPVWNNSETLWTYVIQKYPRKISAAYLNRGNDRYTQNRHQEAIDDYTVAIEINPQSLLAYQNRGLAYLLNNDLDRALRDYNRYLELMSPYDISGNEVNIPLSNALGNRGVIFSKTGQYEKALSDYNAAIKLNPDNANHYLNRALAYYQVGRREEAKRDVRTMEMLGVKADPSLKILLHTP